MTVIINIVGIGRGSGKTALVEAITRKLSKRVNVWTVKHISTFFDTADKDTWRHLSAGSKATLAVTKNEIITIRKSATASLGEALTEIPQNADLLLIEGFKKSGYSKVVVAQKKEDAREVLNMVSHVFAIYGGEKAKTNWKEVDGVPVMRLTKLISTIEGMVLTDIANRLPRSNCRRCGFPSCDDLAHSILAGKATLQRCNSLLEPAVCLTINDKSVHMSSFPRELVKNIVLGIVSSLTGVEENRIGHLNLDIKV